MANVFPLKPMEHVWQWQYDGLCRTLSPNLFFHPDRERGSARRRRDENAKQVCFQCPVMRQCRGHALAAREPYGVWGGMSEHELRTARMHDRDTA
ncbi:WhiB family transcriptional regulator [soil metagenome]